MKMTLNGYYCEQAIYENYLIQYNFCMVLDFQTWIGYVDVKSTPTYFYVQKSTDLSITETGTTIPFEVEKLNVGGAMNLPSGIFTAPRDGIYFFLFSGAAHFPVSTSEVQLQTVLSVNGVIIAYGSCDETSTNANDDETCVLYSTLHLQAGDQVSVRVNSFSSGTMLHGTSNTYFTGWLLEEDISLKLA